MTASAQRAAVVKIRYNLGTTIWDTLFYNPQWMNQNMKNNKSELADNFSMTMLCNNGWYLIIINFVEGLRDNIGQTVSTGADITGQIVRVATPLVQTLAQEVGHMFHNQISNSYYHRIPRLGSGVLLDQE